MIDLVSNSIDLIGFAETWYHMGQYSEYDMPLPSGTQTGLVTAAIYSGLTGASGLSMSHFISLID